MSGNRLRLHFLAGLVFLSSCGIFSGARKSGEKNVVIVQPDKPENTTQETNENKEKENTGGKTEKEKSRWDKKSAYNLAYILPFSLDSSQLDFLMHEDHITGYQPLASLEFYEGALLALDTLKAMGVSLNIYTYDDRKDSTETADLFSRDTLLPSMDLVLGPVFNECLKVGADFAKKHTVFLVSPLSPAGGFTDSNKYFIMANATLETQLSGLVQYILQKQPDAHFISVFRADQEPENSIAAAFAAVFRKASFTYPLATLNEVAAAQGIEPNLHDGKNFIFLASGDPLYADGIIRDLSGFSRNADITLLGLPSLLNIESLQLDYFETLHFQYPTAYWIDPNSPRLAAFQDAFIGQYHMKPSEYACRGYDLTLYFGYLMMQYGPDIADNISRYNPVSGSMLYQFRFEPEYSGDSVRFYENKHITILRYDNYRFEKAN